MLDALDLEFQDIDREMKLRRRLGNLRQHDSVACYTSTFKTIQLELGERALDDNAALHQFIEGLR